MPKQIFFAIIDGQPVVAPKTKSFDGATHCLRFSNEPLVGTAYPFVLGGNTYVLKTPTFKGVGKPTIVETSSLHSDTFLQEGELSLDGNDVKTANISLRKELREEELHKLRMASLAGRHGWQYRQHH